MVKLKTLVALLLMLVFIAAFSGSAQTQVVAQSSDDHGNSSTSFSHQDADWLRSVIRDSEYYTLAGNMAQTRAKFLSTRQLGAIEVIDNLASFNTENDLAQRNGLIPDYRLKDKDNANLQRLQPLLGRPFDLAYLQLEIIENKQSIASAQQEVRSGSNPAVRALAAAEIPIFLKHQAYAQAIFNSIVTGGNGRGIITQSDLNKKFAPEPLPPDPIPTPTPKPTPTPTPKPTPTPTPKPTPTPTPKPTPTPTPKP